MALSSIVKQYCQAEGCGKVAVEKSRVTFGKTKIITLECGHTTHDEVMSNGNKIDIKSILKGCTLMDYQVTGVEFLQNANARAILADEQGLGKTLEVLALIKLHQKELTPAVIVVPATVKLQWHHEIINKCGVEGFLTQVIDSGKVMAAPGFDIYIITYDLLKNYETCFALVKDNIKFVALDECQRIKNHDTGRAKAVQKFVKAMNVEKIVPMSGTPIENNAGEYFTILNLVAPRLFPQYIKFIENDCDSYSNGWGYKVGGLRNPTLFHEKTKDFIIRRRQKDVLQDLPELSRRFYHVELDRKLNKAYAKLMEELEEQYYNEELSGFEKQGNMLAIMNKMRQITGISKTAECLDFVTEFLESHDEDRKIVIFAHHHAAEDKLEIELNRWLIENHHDWKVIRFKSGDDFEVKGQHFKNSDSRVMIASTQAGGVGGNLQFVSDAVMLERQWNPSKESQAEKRHHRYGQKNAVTVTYMIASGTIDEYFTELVEQKRAIVASSLDGEDQINWNEQSLMSELAQTLVLKGKKAWKL
jgi:SNF2 family DNA or RNA helicase